MRPHVAVGQLIPRLGKSGRELVWVFMKTLRNRPVNGVEAQREVGRQHRRAMLLAGDMRVGHVFRRILGDPLMRARRALGQFPLMAEQVVEKQVGPFGRLLRPGHFQAAGDGVGTIAAAIAVGPAQTLLLDARTFGFGADILVGHGGTMRLAERVPARDQSDGFLVIHRHAGEGLANVVRGEHGVGVTVRAFGVDVDQPHLHRRQRVGEFALARIAATRLFAGL
ncbi:hypothetical protein D9M73_122340 [compost metagenome]